MPPVPAPLQFPASYDQERMWFFHRLDPANPSYNVPLVLRLRGPLDPTRLARALQRVADRHEILRTTYAPAQDGTLGQLVHERLPLPLDTRALDRPPTEPAEQDPRVREFLRETVRTPFDLTARPPVRAGLLRLAADDHLLALCLHHIATDGWSLGLLVGELDVLYRAESEGRPAVLPELPVQYADYAEWQRTTLTPEALAPRFDHWREVLGDRPPRLTLPTDRPRPARPSFRGARLDFDLPTGTHRSLRDLAGRHGVTLHMTLLAAWNALLHRYGAGERIVVGTLLANRDNPQLASLMGLFVNTLPVRVDVDGDLPFAELLGRVRAASLDVLAHQDTPVDGIVRALGASGDGGGSGGGANPLFQVLFALQNFADQHLELGGLDVERLDDEEESTRFDLELHVWEHPDRLRGSLVFDTDLFDRATAQRLVAHYRALLESAVRDPAAPVGTLPLRTARQERVLLDRMRDHGPLLVRDAAGRVPPENVPGDVWTTKDGAPAPTAQRGLVRPDGTVLTFDAVGPDARVPGAARVGGRRIALPDLEEDLLRATPGLADVAVLPRARTAPTASASGGNGPSGTAGSPRSPGGSHAADAAGAAAGAGAGAGSGRGPGAVGGSGGGGVSEGAGASGGLGSPGGAGASDPVGAVGGAADGVGAASGAGVGPGLGPGAPGAVGGSGGGGAFDRLRGADGGDRLAGGSEVELVAFAVPGGSLDLGELAARMPGPAAVVPVSRLPLTPEGAVDVRELLRLPVADEDEAQRLERRLREEHPGEPVAVLATATAPAEPRRVRVPAPRPDAAPVPDDDAAPSAGPAPHSGPGPESEAGAGAARPGRPALADGGPPTATGDRTLVDSLLRAAATGTGDFVALDRDGGEHRLTYPELLARARHALAGLRESGLGAGDRVVLQLEDHTDFVTVLWACLLGGQVAVPLAVPADYRTRDAATERLRGACEMLGHPLVVTAPDRLDELREAVAAQDWPQLRAACPGDLLTAQAGPAQPRPADPDDPVLLMLTSGSTGRPKAVVLRHRNVLARSAATAAANRLRSDDVTFNWLPLDHVGGVVMFHLRDVFLGCRQVHAPTGWVLQDPLRWLDAAHRFRATATWAPNFAFGLVNDRAADLERRGAGWDLSPLRFVMNAGEAIVARTARRWLRLLIPYGLPETAMRPAWGMSETSSAMVYSDRFRLEGTADEDAFVEVGAPLPGSAVRIVGGAPGDGPGGGPGGPGGPGGASGAGPGAAGDPPLLAEGETGRLQVRGPTVTSGYHAAPEQNAAAFTADGWFDTGDLGRITGGRLTLTGRAKDVVILGGVNYHSHEIESVVEQLDCVEPSFTAAVAVRSATATTDELAVFFHPRGRSAPADSARRVRQAVRDRVGVNPRHVIPVERAQVPKTEIGKIQRAALRARFEAGAFTEPAGDGTAPDHFHRAAWVPRALPPAPLEPRPADTVLILPGPVDVARRLARALEAAGRRPVLRGDGPAADPGDGPAAVVDLRAYGGGPDIQPGAARAELHDLLGLAADAAGATSVYVVTSHAQSVLPQDPAAYERAPLAAVVATLGHERTDARVVHLDLPPGDPEEVARVLAEEVARVPRERVVAYRGGRRLARRLMPARPDGPGTGAGAGTGAGTGAGAGSGHGPRHGQGPGSGRGSAPVGAPGSGSSPGSGSGSDSGSVSAPGPGSGPVGLRVGGRYLVTGATGGIGRLLVAELAGTYRAHVLCVGRTAPPGAADPLVEHAVADVRDVEAVGRALRDAEARWGAPLDGAFHLAGGYREVPLDRATAAGMDEALAAKTGGARVLHALLRDRPGTLLVSFSSVNGLFGGASVAGYAAANAFLDALAVHQRQAHGLRAYSLAWTMWDETGMSAGYPLKGLTQARGYRVLPPREALASLAVALERDVPHQLVGLDPARPWIAAQLAGPAEGLRELTAYGTPGAAAGASAGESGADRFGTPLVHRRVVVEELPLDPATGEVRRDLLAGAGSPAGTAPGTAPGPADGEPRPGLESAIAAAWSEVLGVPHITRGSNFFDLGGGSLQATRVHGLLQQRLGRELAMVELFRRPTVHALAAALEEDGSAPPAAGDRGRTRAERRLRAASARPR